MSLYISLNKRVACLEYGVERERRERGEREECVCERERGREGEIGRQREKRERVGEKRERLGERRSEDEPIDLRRCYDWRRRQPIVCMW